MDRLSILEIPRKPRRAPAPAETPEIPKFWQCPSCIYRIALDFPGGIGEAIAGHRNAHLLAEMGIVRKIEGDLLLRPGTPRR